jgi:hypothetical protein
MSHRRRWNWGNNSHRRWSIETGLFDESESEDEVDLSSVATFANGFVANGNGYQVFPTWLDTANSIVTRVADCMPLHSVSSRNAQLLEAQN